MRMIGADGDLVGRIRLHWLSTSGRGALLAIGRPGAPHLGRGIGPQAVALLRDHGFGVLDLHRVGLRVLAFNGRGVRCCAACGLGPESRLRNTAFMDSAGATRF